MPFPKFVILKPVLGPVDFDEFIKRIFTRGRRCFGVACAFRRIRGAWLDWNICRRRPSVEMGPESLVPGHSPDRDHCGCGSVIAGGGLSTDHNGNDPTQPGWRCGLPRLLHKPLAGDIDLL